MHLATHQILHSRRRAVEGNVRHVDARALVQNHAGKVGGVARREGRIRHLAGIGFGPSHKLLHVIGGHIGGIHRHHHGRAQKVGHWLEALLRVIGQARKGVRVDGKHAGVGQQERRAIRRGLHHVLRGNDAAAAGLVVHNQRLACVGLKDLGHLAQRGIQGVAGGKGHHHFHRAVGEARGTLRKQVVREGRDRQGAQAGQGGSALHRRLLYKNFKAKIAAARPHAGVAPAASCGPHARSIPTGHRGRCWPIPRNAPAG